MALLQYLLNGFKDFKACLNHCFFTYEGAKPPTPLFASKYAATPEAGLRPRNAPPEFYSDIPRIFWAFFWSDGDNDKDNDKIVIKS